MKKINEIFFNEFISALNAKDIKYLILRNYKFLPEVGNDIDFLIDKYQLQRTIKILYCLARNNGVSIRRCLDRYGLISFLCAKDGHSVQIDLFTKLSKKWCPYADHSVVLDNRIKYKTFFVPSEPHELILISLKEILTYEIVREKYIDDFDKKIFFSIEDISTLCGSYFNDRDISKLISHVNNRLIFKERLVLNRNIQTLFKPLDFIHWLAKRLFNLNILLCTIS